MNKTLILVRHSIAANRYSSFSDFNRTLTSEGKSDSEKMANFLFKSGITPDFILTSSAARALETAMIFAKIFKTDKKNILSTRKLYYSSAKTMLDQIYGMPETINRLMILAHNPGISDLARGLSAGKSTFMDNTQISILEYNLEHWHQIDEQKPLTYKSFRPIDITD